jgi:hypothetical protein
MGGAAMWVTENEARTWIAERSAKNAHSNKALDAAAAALTPV